MAVPNRLFTSPPNISDFQAICSQSTSKHTYPLAMSISSNIPIYDAAALKHHDPATTTALQNEWHHILHTGPGIFILKNMYGPDQYDETLNSTTTAFTEIIAHERAASASSSTKKPGDHFSSGANDRIWNSFSKHALHHPRSFIHYYSNPWLNLISQSWLGPRYRITAQVNVVKPGGNPQHPHRDYHLGFQDEESAAAFPKPVHRLSQFLTLQGAVAHSDMPPESGPTRFLPFSQNYEPGYLAAKREEFQRFFDTAFVALPMARGDGVFFNPGVMHAAGGNDMPMPMPMSDGPGEGGGEGFRRIANLLQISSALGKAMEAVDPIPLVEAVWDILLDKVQTAGLDHVRDVVAAIADGYPFPTNLDKRPPAPSGMAPESEQEIVLRGLEERWGRERIVGELRTMKSESAAYPG